MTMMVSKEPGRREKALWIFSCFMLLLLEVFALNAERIKQNDNEERTRVNEQRHFETVMARFETLQNVTQSLSQARVRVERFAVQTPKESLKKKAALLSKDILQFLAQRAKVTPVYPFVFDETGKYEQDRQRFDRETGTLYLDQFAVRVTETWRELKQKGVNVKDTEEHCIWAASVGSIPSLEMCAVRLGVSADELP